MLNCSIRNALTKGEISYQPCIPNIELFHRQCITYVELFYQRDIPMPWHTDHDVIRTTDHGARATLPEKYKSSKEGGFSCFLFSSM